MLDLGLSGSFLTLRVPLGQHQALRICCSSGPCLGVRRLSHGPLPELGLLQNLLWDLGTLLRASVFFKSNFQTFSKSLGSPYLSLSSTAGGAGGSHGVDCRKGLNPGGCPPTRFIPGPPHLQVIFRFALALFKYKEEEVLRLQEPMAIFKYLRYFTRTILDAR